MQRTPQTDAMWREYRAAHPDVPDRYDMTAFGDSPAMADELAALVALGVKRATAAALPSFGADEPLPRAGDHVVLVDGEQRPVCVWRTSDVEIKPLAAVDDQFAWDEGEGERTRAWWLEAHRRYFTREAARWGARVS